MENNLPNDQEFACEDCGFTSPLTNDVCPNCSGRMTALDSAPRTKGDEGAGTESGDDAEFADADSGALSLESLQEQESKDEFQAEDDYGDGE